MSPDDLKRDLGVFLDFSKEHSASVNWIDTIPPKFKDAIQDHRAVIGMDSEMVMAAMGRPDHKVRERDPSGTETEDWIYGSPPHENRLRHLRGRQRDSRERVQLIEANSAAADLSLTFPPSAP